MRRRGDLGSLAERTGAAQRDLATTTPPAPVPPSTDAPAPPVKPCWVTDRHGRLPGLLLGWRRTSEGFQGRVVRAVRDDEGWIVVEEWMPATMLAPAAPE